MAADLHRRRVRRLGRAAQDLDPRAFLVQLALSDQLLRTVATEAKDGLTIIEAPHESEPVMNFHIPAATTIVATILIVISLALLFRWHIVSSSIGVHRLDRWTGKVEFCSQPDGKIICH